MRKALMASVVASLMVLPAMAVTINNPGFEDGTGTITVPPSWTDYGRDAIHKTDPPSTIHIPGTNNESTYQGESDDRSPEGSRSYSSHGGNHSGGIYQVVDVSAVQGMDMTLSAYAYYGHISQWWHEFGIIKGSCDNPDDLSGYLVWAYKWDGWGQDGFWNNGSGTTGTATSVDAGVPGNWELTSVDFTVPADATTMTIYTKSGASSDLAATWVDNLVLVPEPAAALLLVLPMLFMRRRRR